jgi:hypothetical protein
MRKPHSPKPPRRARRRKNAAEDIGQRALNTIMAEGQGIGELELFPPGRLPELIARAYCDEPSATMGSAICLHCAAQHGSARELRRAPLAVYSRRLMVELRALDVSDQTGRA